MPNQNKIRIAIIEDDEDDFLIIKDYILDIEGKSFVVDWFQDYNAAIEAIKNKEYHLYFVDYFLGHKTGLDLLDAAAELNFDRPIILLTGLGNKAIDEAKERIRSAFSASKLPFPKKRITINLAPADIPKESSSFDVAIASAILLSATPYKGPQREYAYIGELSLDGNVRAVRGIIGKLLGGKRNGIHNFIIPKANIEQADHDNIWQTISDSAFNVDH